MTTRTPYTYHSPAEIDAKLAELQAEEARLQAMIEANRAKQAPFKQEYTNRGGWSRAFIVTDGHVHSSTACSTCYITTRFGWLTDLSGQDEAEIVGQAGERACTVCYPTAPVNVLNRPSQLSTEEERQRDAERSERAAAKTARAAKAAANAPTASGEPLRVKTGSWTETFKTERSALIWAVQQVEYAQGLRRDMNDLEQAGVDLVCASVAEKRGVPAAEVAAEVQAKGAAKAAKWASA